MTQAENNNIDEIVNELGKMMHRNPFSIEFQVKEKPQGIKIIFEVSREQMDMIAQSQIE